MLPSIPLNPRTTTASWDARPWITMDMPETRTLAPASATIVIDRPSIRSGTDERVPGSNLAPYSPSWTRMESPSWEAATAS